MNPNFERFEGKSCDFYKCTVFTTLLERRKLVTSGHTQALEVLNFVEQNWFLCDLGKNHSLFLISCQLVFLAEKFVKALCVNSATLFWRIIFQRWTSFRNSFWKYSLSDVKLLFFGGHDCWNICQNKVLKMIPVSTLCFDEIYFKVHFSQLIRKIRYFHGKCGN